MSETNANPLPQAPSDNRPSPPKLPEAPAPAPTPLRTGGQETDVWWGSYSGWTMLPSLAFCIVLTAGIVVLSWLIVPRGWVKLSVFGGAGIVWLIELIRLAHRVFGYNYRLTTHRLYVSKGFRHAVNQGVEFVRLGNVAVTMPGHLRWFGIGHVSVAVEDRDSMILEGIRQPERIAEKLRELTAQAKE